MDVNEKGQVLVLFALVLVVLIGLAALGIDVGYMYTVRHELQRCADAGALAGASRFINGPGETGTWAEAAVQAEATVRAIDFATKDNVVQTKLDPSNGNDNIVVTFDQGPDRIKVQTERTVPLFFSKLFLGPTKRITAYAVAEATSVSASTKCLAPFGIPLPWVENGSDPLAYEDGVDQIIELGDYLDGDGKPLKEDDPAHPCYGMNEVTVWDYHAHDNVSARSARDSRLCAGSLMTLKIGKPGQTFEPGHFLALDYSSLVTNCPPGVDINSGANFYKFMIMNNDCETGCQVDISLNDDLDTIPIEPGNMVGPTIQAVAPTYYKNPLGFIGPDPEEHSLMNGNGATSDYDSQNYNDQGFSGTFPFGGTHADWDFSANSPVTTVTDTRHIQIPVYDPRNPPAPGGGTKSNIKPVAFVGFWIQDISENQGTIVGRIKSVVGSGLGGPTPGPGGETLKTIRLVE
jgi:Flp pilus assembly protein TadG